jgi:hypothetical protein
MKLYRATQDYGNTINLRTSNTKRLMGAETAVQGAQATQGGGAMRRKRVLSLDGGGIRGISSLLILQSIMECIRELCGHSETLRPCEFFDLIGGTSTGG